MKSAETFSTIVILTLSFASFIPITGLRVSPSATYTVTSIVRVTTTIDMNATFAFQNKGTYRIPVLVLNVTLVVSFNGLTGVISGQLLNFAASWGPTASCITDSQGVCFLTFSSPPLGGANTITASYGGNSYFAPCVVTKVV